MPRYHILLNFGLVPLYEGLDVIDTCKAHPHIPSGHGSAVRASPPTPTQWHVYNIYLFIYLIIILIKSSNPIGSVKLTPFEVVNTYSVPKMQMSFKEG